MFSLFDIFVVTFVFGTVLDALQFCNIIQIKKAFTEMSKS